MITIQVFKKSIAKNDPIKIQNYLYWYDDKKKKLRKLKGGKLSLKLVYGKRTDRWRSVPKIEDIYIHKKIDNTSVKEWFEKYSNYNDSSAEMIYETNESILYNIEDVELDNFTYELERNSIQFDILEK
jgi:hypothetical protein